MELLLVTLFQLKH